MGRQGQHDHQEEVESDDQKQTLGLEVEEQVEHQVLRSGHVVAFREAFQEAYLAVAEWKALGVPKASG